jgi:molybdate/tungstate transport system ATP-binding protein
MIELRQMQIRQDAFQLGPVNLLIHPGEYVVVMGQTGSGKSTLLECITGLRPPTSGEVLLRSKLANSLSCAERNLGYVPQDSAIFPTMTVAENLAFGLSTRGWPRKQIDERVAELASVLRLQELLHRRAVNLSGGEARRIALGRALAFRPDILLLDEPLTGLDEQTHELILTYLGELKKEYSFSALHVTHDEAEARFLADKLYILRGGQLELARSEGTQWPAVPDSSNKNSTHS